MAFDCAYRGIRIDESARLTRDVIAAAARAHGLSAVYVVADVEVIPRRWRRHTVDVVVHMADGDDVLGMQFPDEARAAITAAMAMLLHAPHVALAPSSPRGAPARLPGSTAPR